MRVNYQDISEEALRGIAQQYICSNLSDSDVQIDLESWTEQVIASVKKGELVIDFSENNESVYLRRLQDLPME